MKEQRINDILVKLISGEIKTSDAVRLTGLSERQIYRKKKAYKQNGITSVPHKSKNKSNGKGYSDELKDMILNLYLDEYSGWNFYHFNDTLEDYHHIKVLDNFIYNLLTSNGIHSPNEYKKKKSSHPPRERRENAGELTIPINFKGLAQEKMPRFSKRRKSASKKVNHKVCILGAIDENDNQYLEIVDYGEITSDDIEKSLGSKLSNATYLITDCKSAYESFAKTSIKIRANKIIYI